MSHVLEDMTEPGENSGESSLWVDKYRPRGYMDLLSDEVSSKLLKLPNWNNFGL